MRVEDPSDTTQAEVDIVARAGEWSVEAEEISHDPCGHVVTVDLPLGVAYLMSLMRQHGNCPWTNERPIYTGKTCPCKPETCCDKCCGVPASIHPDGCAKEPA